MLKRCARGDASPHDADEHDHEWGVLVHDKRKLLEMLPLEAIQGSLGWALILKKRAGYRQAVDTFDVQAIARYDEQQ